MSKKKITTVTTTTEIIEDNSSSNFTEIVCILDRSGSMHSIRDDAIGGFNSFLEEQKKLPGDANMTLVLFDDQYDVVHDAVPIRRVEPLTHNTFVPRGSTALLDAIGRTINKINSHGNGAKVIVSILTDGQENCSTEFRRQDIFDMITKHKNKGWEFIYLAANQDAIGAGTSMGFTANRSFNIGADSVGMSATYGAINYATSNMRKKGKLDDADVFTMSCMVDTSNTDGSDKK